MHKEKLKCFLKKNFKIKDIGEAKYILGMKITRDRKTGKLWLDQERYLTDILKRFNMEDCKSVNTPVDVNQKLSAEFSPTKDEERKLMQDVPYQEAIGSLLYAAQISRPDIAFAVGPYRNTTKILGVCTGELLSVYLDILKEPLIINWNFRKSQTER